MRMTHGRQKQKTGIVMSAAMHGRQIWRYCVPSMTTQSVKVALCPNAVHVAWPGRAFPKSHLCESAG